MTQNFVAYRLVIDYSLIISNNILLLTEREGRTGNHREFSNSQRKTHQIAQIRHLEPQKRQ